MKPKIFKNPVTVLLVDGIIVNINDFPIFLGPRRTSSRTPTQAYTPSLFEIMSGLKHIFIVKFKLNTFITSFIEFCFLGLIIKNKIASEGQDKFGVLFCSSPKMLV